MAVKRSIGKTTDNIQWFIIFLLALTIFYMFYREVNPEPVPALEIVTEAAAKIEESVKQEEVRHQKVINQIREVRNVIVEEVQALEPDDVASALNNELLLWRNIDDSKGMVSTKTRILYGRAGRARPVSGDTVLQN